MPPFTFHIPHFQSPHLHTSTHTLDVRATHLCLLRLLLPPASPSSALVPSSLAAVVAPRFVCRRPKKQLNVSFHLHHIQQ
jgi:hypothetical protein